MTSACAVCRRDVDPGDDSVVRLYDGRTICGACVWDMMHRMRDPRILLEADP